MTRRRKPSDGKCQHLQGEGDCRLRKSFSSEQKLDQTKPNQTKESNVFAASIHIVHGYSSRHMGHTTWLLLSKN